MILNHEQSSTIIIDCGQIFSVFSHDIKQSTRHFVWGQTKEDRLFYHSTIIQSILVHICISISWRLDHSKRTIFSFFPRLMPEFTHLHNHADNRKNILLNAIPFSTTSTTTPSRHLSPYSTRLRFCCFRWSIWWWWPESKIAGTS